MATGVIRPAKAEDIEALSRLKADYFKCLCQGFLPADMLTQTSPEAFAQNFLECMHSPGTHLDLMLQDGKYAAFIVYGVEREDPTLGWIADAGMDLTMSALVRETLFHHTLTVLCGAGCTRVQQWVLRENFRLRFHMEKLGFKADGTRRTVLYGGHSMVMARYVYRLGGEEN